MENQVIVSDYSQMDRILREERQYILDICKKIKKAGCNVLLIQKSILRWRCGKGSSHSLVQYCAIFLAFLVQIWNWPNEKRARGALHYITRGSLCTSQISHLLLYPSLRLVVPGLSGHFHYYFLYNLLLRATLVGNIFEKWLQDFVRFGNPWSPACFSSLIGLFRP